MSALPTWIEDRIDRNLDNTLTQEHVVETMVGADRPFFSTRQLQSRVKPDVSTATVRNRLDELQELDVVATETYPDSVTLYYVDYPESDWPLSPEGQRALAAESPLERLSSGLLGTPDTGSPRRLLVAGVTAVLLGSGVAALVGVGLLLDVGGLESVVGGALAGTGVVVWSMTLELLVVGLFLAAAERRSG